MKNIKKSFYGLSIILLAVLLMFVWLFSYLINIRKQNIKSVLEIDEIKAERIISDNFNHTSSIIANMNLQIEERPKDKNHINNILTKYKTHPSLIDTFSWTIFSWADADNNITVDAIYEIMKKPISLSDRDYIALTHKNPARFYLGTPVIGSTSKKWMIPGGIGLIDKSGKYVGTMTIGFEIDALAKIIQKNIKNNNVAIGLFDGRNNLPIFYSSSEKIESSQNQPKPNSQIIALLEKAKSSNNTIFKASIIGDQYGYLVKKIDNYNFFLVLEYNSAAINSELWKSIWSRMVEIILVMLVSGILTFLIYKRENDQKRIIIGLKEKAEKANEDKTNLLKIISHDLRNYISGIYGLANIIINNDDENSKAKSDENIKYTKMIISQADEMMEFVQDLLDINHAESGGIIKLGKLENCDVKKLLERMLFLNHHFAKEHQVKVITAIEDNLPFLKCDKRRFKQILDNLVTNAIKYSPKNSQLKITAGYIETQQKLYIEIADNGIGMSEEDIKKALEGSGAQIDKSALDKPFDSHGIGLPLVKRLVDLHNAKMEIDSVKNKGTKFKLWFDVDVKTAFVKNEIHQANAGSVSDQNNKSHNKDSGKTIIIADDQEFNLIFLEKGVFKNTNHKIFKAKNGKEVLEILDKENCDLVLMDVEMPVMNGLEVARAIRTGQVLKHCKNYKTIPIIAISGNSDEESKKEAMDAGMNDVIIKGKSAPEILEMIKQFLSKS